MITLIAAIGAKNEIGFKNKLLWKIPEDMRHFRNYTLGKVIIMGHNTFLGIGAKPLPGRRNVVVSHKNLYGDAIKAKNIKEALSIEEFYPELVVIGGESIYNQTLEFADKLVITHIDAEFEADAYFPTIDCSIWKVNNILGIGITPYHYTFVEYGR